MSRHPSCQVAVPTPFGKAYITLEYDPESGRTVGGWLSYRNQLEDNRATSTEESALISKLMDQLAMGLNSALQQLAQEFNYLETTDDQPDSTTGEA